MCFFTNIQSYFLTCFTGVGVWFGSCKLLLDDSYDWMIWMSILRCTWIDRLTLLFCFKFLDLIPQQLTPPKFNMEPEKTSPEKEVPLGNHHVQGNHVKIRGSRSFITLQDFSKWLHNYQVIPTSRCLWIMQALWNYQTIFGVILAVS